MQSINFHHRQSAHCETGVAANLLTHHGLEISEPMAFGIGAGLFFAHFPFIKLFTMPMTTFRSMPGAVFKRVCGQLGVAIRRRRFRRPDVAMAALDEALAQGRPVGLQTGAYWLPYFPQALRFHFNGHNLVVIGKQGEEYLISDPVFERPLPCSAENLKKARFSKGELAPRGLMYEVVKVPAQVDLPRAVVSGIRVTCRGMLRVPLPFIGVRGMRYLARRMEGWPEKLGEPKASLHLGHLIRMLEEIGTGGAGFRFIYAAFLQEAATVLQRDELLALAGRMTEIGDAWRTFAVIGARHCKGRAGEGESFAAMADIVRQCAGDEAALYKELLRVLDRG